MYTMQVEDIPNFTNLVTNICFCQLGGPVSVTSHTNNKLTHVSLSQYLLRMLVIKFH